MNRSNEYSLPTKLYDEILEYTKTNELNLQQFLDRLIESSFTSEKYRDFIPPSMELPETTTDDVEHSLDLSKPETKENTDTNNIESSEVSEINETPPYKLKTDTDDYEHYDR